MTFEIKPRKCPLDDCGGETDITFEEYIEAGLIYINVPIHQCKSCKFRWLPSETEQELDILVELERCLKSSA